MAASGGGGPKGLLLRVVSAAAAASSAARAFTPDLPPLLIYYSATHQDNAVVATLAGAASLDATYALVHAGAPLATNASSCSGGASSSQAPRACMQALDARRRSPHAARPRDSGSAPASTSN